MKEKTIVNVIMWYFNHDLELSERPLNTSKVIEKIVELINVKIV